MPNCRAYFDAACTAAGEGTFAFLSVLFLIVLWLQTGF